MKELTKYIIERLTKDYVTIHKIDTIYINGREININQPHTTTYNNTILDRECLSKEVPEPYLASILTVWGNE